MAKTFSLEELLKAMTEFKDASGHDEANIKVKVVIGADHYEIESAVMTNRVSGDGNLKVVFLYTTPVGSRETKTDVP